jgi:hypothetical protein
MSAFGRFGSKHLSSQFPNRGERVRSVRCSRIYNTRTAFKFYARPRTRMARKEKYEEWNGRTVLLIQPRNT